MNENKLLLLYIQQIFIMHSKIIRNFVSVFPEVKKHVQVFLRICIWLILCRSFHKLKNIVKFYKEFIFVIIERINMQISTFCHIGH